MISWQIKKCSNKQREIDCECNNSKTLSDTNASKDSILKENEVKTAFRIFEAKEKEDVKTLTLHIDTDDEGDVMDKDIISYNSRMLKEWHDIKQHMEVDSVTVDVEDSNIPKKSKKGSKKSKAVNTLKETM